MLLCHIAVFTSRMENITDEEAGEDRDINLTSAWMTWLPFLFAFVIVVVLVVTLLFLIRKCSKNYIIFFSSVKY